MIQSMKTKIEPSPYLTESYDSKVVLLVIGIESIKLLHITPERNLHRVFKANNKIKYFNGDLNPLMAEKVIDITDINFENNYFNFIICNHDLEHVKYDRKAMRELFRILKPGGEAILQVPMFRIIIKTYEDFSIVLSEGREKYFTKKITLE